MMNEILKSKRIRLAGLVGLMGLLGLLSGCSAVPLAQQRLVAKPEMGFDLTANGHPPVNLMSQVEPGLAATAGAQATGCTSCR